MCDSSNDFRSSRVGSRTTSSPRILYCINIDRAANPMSVGDTRNPILALWSELYNISTRPCQHLRLYSVVVSTLVFETDILSISEYREPGFEPQYDLSFCSSMASHWYLIKRVHKAWFWSRNCVLTGFVTFSRNPRAEKMPCAHMPSLDLRITAPEKESGT